MKLYEQLVNGIATWDFLRDILTVSQVYYFFSHLYIYTEVIQK